MYHVCFKTNNYIPESRTLLQGNFREVFLVRKSVPCGVYLIADPLSRLVFSKGYKTVTFCVIFFLCGGSDSIETVTRLRIDISYFSIDRYI